MEFRLLFFGGKIDDKKEENLIRIWVKKKAKFSLSRFPQCRIAQGLVKERQLGRDFGENFGKFNDAIYVEERPFSK